MCTVGFWAVSRILFHARKNAVSETTTRDLQSQTGHIAVVGCLGDHAEQCGKIAHEYGRPGSVMKYSKVHYTNCLFRGHIYRKYDSIRVDITHGCNLRCPFCINAWNKVGKNVFMTDEVFQKCVDLLPLVEGPNFYLSCLFEPLLHPRLIDLIHKIPIRERRKVFFTTNLTTKISDKALQELSESAIHHINISLDSLDRDLFERLRKGARFENVMHNLERLTKHFSKHPQSPKLFYTILAMKSNYQEIPRLVEALHAKYLCSFAEVRPPWKSDHNAEWFKSEYITEDEYAELRQTLSKQKYCCRLSDRYPEDSFSGTRDPITTAPSSVSLGISADGTVDFLESDVRISINDIANPRSFFDDMLRFLSLNMARAEQLIGRKTVKAPPFLQRFKYNPVIRPVLLSVRRFLDSH